MVRLTFRLTRHVQHPRLLWGLEGSGCCPGVERELFGSDDEGRDAAAGGAIVAVNVGAADAAGADVDEDVGGAEGGVGEVAQLESLGGFEDQGSHGVNDTPGDGRRRLEVGGGGWI